MRSTEPEPLHAAAPWSAVVARAEAQLGVLRRDDLLRLGYGTRVIERRVARSLLHEILPGVFTVGDRLLARNGSLLAALWWCGGDAAISHLSAAAFSGWSPEPPAIHLTTTKELAPPPGVVLHTTTRLPLRHTRVRLGRLRTTDWARTLIDCAELLSYDELRTMADQLPELPLAQLRRVRAELSGRHASGRTRRLLDSEMVRTTSELERRFVRYCTRHGAPHPVGRNVRVAGHRADCVYHDERLVIELDGRTHHERRAQMRQDRRRDADCVYHDERLVIELDGRTHHERRGQMRQDRRRDADYQLAGYRILRVVWEELAYDDPTTATTIRAFLALGAR